MRINLTNRKALFNVTPLILHKIKETLHSLF